MELTGSFTPPATVVLVFLIQQGAERTFVSALSVVEHSETVCTLVAGALVAHSVSKYLFLFPVLVACSSLPSTQSHL